MAEPSSPSGTRKRRRKVKGTADTDSTYEYSSYDLPANPTDQTPSRPEHAPGMYLAHPGPAKQESSSIYTNSGAGLVNLPQKVEIKIKDMPEVDKFTKKKRKARQGQIKVFQDAANSCRIEIDDDGNVLSVMLSDDLANTFLMFGKEEYGTTEPIILQENRLVPLTSKKKPFLRDTPRVTNWLGVQEHYEPFESVAGMGENKKYKKIKVKKHKLKGNKAKSELLFAAEKADLVVDEYTDQIGKVYVAFPDASKHRTYLFSLPQRMNIITEEISREIPIRRAHNDKANWYVQNTSSEESEEEEEDAPVMHETAISAVDDEMPGGVDTRQAIGFHGQACNSKTPQLVLE